MLEQVFQLRAVAFDLVVAERQARQARDPAHVDPLRGHNPANFAPDQPRSRFEASPASRRGRFAGTCRRAARGRSDSPRPRGSANRGPASPDCRRGTRSQETSARRRAPPASPRRSLCAADRGTRSSASRSASAALVVPERAFDAALHEAHAVVDLVEPRVPAASARQPDSLQCPPPTRRAMRSKIAKVPAPQYRSTMRGVRRSAGRACGRSRPTIAPLIWKNDAGETRNGGRSSRQSDTFLHLAPAPGMKSMRRPITALALEGS